MREKLNGIGARVRREHVVLGLIVVMVSSAHLAWIRQDTRPQPFIDPYPQKTLQFVDGLKEQGFTALPRLVLEMSVGARPPLYQLLAVPFIWIAGRSLDSMLLVNVLLGVVLVLATYGVGKLARSRSAGLLAALLVGTYPPIVNLSRIARPHSVLPACVALSLWLLLLLLKTRSLRVAWLFGASLGLGFLTHPNFFYLLPLPSLVFGLYMTFFQTEPKRPRDIAHIPRWSLAKLRDPFVLKGLLPAGALAIALGAVWYLPTSSSAIETLRGALAPWSSVRLGFYNIPPSFWWYALTMPGAISCVYAALLVVSLAVHIVKMSKRCPYGRVLPVTFLLMYCGIAARGGALAWMNFAGVLPVAAVLSAVFVVDVYRSAFSLETDSSRTESALPSPLPAPSGVKRIYRGLSVVLLLVSVGVAIFNFFVVSWRMPPGGRFLARALCAPLDTACDLRMNIAFCPNPPRDEDWRMSEIIQRILENPDCRQLTCTVAVVTKSLENINHSTLSYHLTRDFPGSSIEIEPVARFGDRYFLNWLTSDYVVYVPQIRDNFYSNAIVSLFEQRSPDALKHAYEQVASFSLPNEWTARLLRRTKPLAIDEATSAVEALDVPQDLKNQLLDQVQSLYE